MISSVAPKPLLKTSYTEQGNEYKESNIGKTVAGASVAGATIVYGGEMAFKGAKNIYGKAKTIKMDFSKIKKPGFKAIKENAQSFTKKLNKPSIINVIKSIPAKISNLAHKSVDFAKEGIEFIKANAKKVNIANIKKAGKSAIDFVKTNSKKVNKENFKKAGEAIVNFAKKPSVKYGAGIVAAFAGVFALGYLADTIANKISAHRADKA